MTEKKGDVWSLDFPKEKKADILEQIIKFTHEPRVFRHVVSLNPEILVQAASDDDYRTVLKRADVRLVDGVGLKLASWLLDMGIGDRYTGVDLMSDLLIWAKHSGVKVMLIGGKSQVAERLANRQKSRESSATFFGTSGISDISNPDPIEEEQIFSIVADMVPHIVFIAYGSPAQEKWIWLHRAQFSKSVCIGVGGAFDFLSGEVSRAPKWARSAGLEWLYRLLRQPWRWQRQTRLIIFAAMVLKRLIRRLV
ncbi:MAG: putative N-acetylmannosaminyltransferase [Microgenomates bacterium OLB22]|nr:MAG: putative N-acetylmannosaminyltransferase [Microgenomates bacterium OLB22]